MRKEVQWIALIPAFWSLFFFLMLVRCELCHSLPWCNTYPGGAGRLPVELDSQPQVTMPKYCTNYRAKVAACSLKEEVVTEEEAQWEGGKRGRRDVGRAGCGEHFLPHRPQSCEEGREEPPAHPQKPPGPEQCWNSANLDFREARRREYIYRVPPSARPGAAPHE